MPQNMHYYFNKQYPENLLKNLKNLKKIGEEIDATSVNDDLFSIPFNIKEHKGYYIEHGNTEPFCLQVKYPGLLVGLGNAHATGAKAEVALGFTFDYVTGQPYIPASTVKGILRSAFKHPDYIACLLKKICNADFDKKAIKTLEYEIFEGEYIEENLSLKEKVKEKYPYASFEIQNREKTKESFITLPIFMRDTFYDAFIDFEETKSEDRDNLYPIGKEAITPHGNNPLKAPKPLTLVKVKPGVVFKLCFNLFDGMITSAQKQALFKSILKDIGIGAKTNVGFGVLDDEIDKSIKVSVPAYKPTHTETGSNTGNRRANENTGSDKVFEVTVTKYIIGTNKHISHIEVVMSNGKIEKIHKTQLVPSASYDDEIKKAFPKDKVLKVKYYDTGKYGNQLTMLGVEQ